MLVIGLGRFGGHLARKLSDLGNEVMVVDMDEEAVEKLAPHVTWAQVGDCMDVDTLRSLGVSNFDICFVCISNNFQSSLGNHFAAQGFGRALRDFQDRPRHPRQILAQNRGR